MGARRWTHTRWMKLWGIVNNWIYAKTRWLLMENGNELFVAKTFCLTFPSAVLHGFSCVINQKKSPLKKEKEDMQFEISELHRDSIKIIFLFFHTSNSTRLLRSCDVIHRKAWTGLLNTVQIYSFKLFSFCLNLVQWLKVGANPELQTTLAPKLWRIMRSQAREKRKLHARLSRKFQWKSCSAAHLNVLQNRDRLTLMECSRKSSLPNWELYSLVNVHQKQKREITY